MVVSNLDISFWEKNLGLLPVPLYHQQSDGINKFVLLNGGRSNFCLDLDVHNKLSASEYRSAAWSSDVDSFINVENEKIFLYRWGSFENEVYRIKTVTDNLSKFYQYLADLSSPSENSIITWSVKNFRSIRNFIGEQEEAEKSLKAFLYIIACSESDVVELNLDQWGLDQSYAEVPTLINVEAFVSQFNEGLSFYKLKPDSKLLLRHAAGRLFQEAHYEATLNRQLNISGTTPTDYKHTVSKYSSIHFTPSYIARSVVEEALKSFKELPETLRILDPTCGSGEFLKEALRQLKRKAYRGSIEIYGWDISDPAVSMAKFILSFESKEWNNISINLLTCDSLATDWESGFDIILMNPPFLSWELMSADEKEKVTATLGNTYNKKANMAGAFFLKAFNALNANGVLGCVLPSSILNTDSHTTLREMFNDGMSTRLIAKLGNYVFQSAFTDACLYIGYKPKQNNSITTVLWTYNTAKSASEALRSLRKRSDTEVISTQGYSIYPIENDELAGSWMPISYTAWKFIKDIELYITDGQLKRSKDIFNIREGVNTGNNSVFLISRSDLEKLPKQERKYFRPAVANKAIRNGILYPNTFVWYPYSSDLKPILTENDLQEAVPKFYNQILKTKKTELQKEYKANWWDLLRPRKDWQTKKEPHLISATFGRSGFFAYDKSGEFVIQRGHVWFPKKHDLFNDNTYYAYLAIFCSDFFNSLLPIYCKQIAGGYWWDLSKRFVENIPLPDFTSELITSRGEYEQLSNIGKAISDENMASENLEAIVQALYGIE